MKYGILAPDGSIEQEVDECAVTGREVLGRHSTMEQIRVRHFVRYLSHKAESITDEMRSEWYADTGETPVKEAVEAPASSVEKEAGASRRSRKESSSEAQDSAGTAPANGE